MKYIIIILSIFIVACCTPGECPKENIYINVVFHDGSRALVKIPKGMLNDPKKYYTQEEINEYIKQQQQQKNKYGI